ncbi:MAG: hypothetical protein Q7N50_10730, partial [Armatimonadota bacterium]|nr:hypothetical protein [Armatimonadota bacterium]
NGIEPLSKAYESFVLPLNYTGEVRKYEVCVRTQSRILRTQPVQAYLHRLVLRSLVRRRAIDATVAKSHLRDNVCTHLGEAGEEVGLV